MSHVIPEGAGNWTLVSERAGCVNYSSSLSSSNSQCLLPIPCLCLSCLHCTRRCRVEQKGRFGRILVLVFGLGSGLLQLPSSMLSKYRSRSVKSSGRGSESMEEEYPLHRDWLWALPALEASDPAGWKHFLVLHSWVHFVCCYPMVSPTESHRKHDTPQLAVLVVWACLICCLWHLIESFCF